MKDELKLNLLLAESENIQECWLHQTAIPSQLSDIDIQRQIHFTQMDHCLFFSNSLDVPIKKYLGGVVKCEGKFLAVVNATTKMHICGPESARAQVQEKYPECEYVIATDHLETLGWLYNHDSLGSEVVAPRDAAAEFKHTKIDKLASVMQRQHIEAIDLKDPALKYFQQGHTESAYANQAVGAMTLGSPLAPFPVSRSDADGKTVSDYAALMRLMAEKFKENPVDEITIQCFDIHPLIALSGLELGSFPANSLSINLSDLPSEDKERGLFYLKVALVKLSNMGLAAVKIEGLELSELERSALIKLMGDYSIRIDISLPEQYQKTKDQKDIDEITSRNAFENRQYLQRDAFVETVSAPRSRVKAAFTPTIDVELQQEVEVEVQVEAAAEASRSSDSSGHLEEMIWYDFSKFYDELVEEDSYCNLPSDKEQLQLMWGNWFGEFSDTYPKIKVSAEALNYLVAHQDQLGYGLGFIKHFDQVSHLPAGFSVLVKDGAPHLYYNERDARIIKGSKLALTFEDRTKTMVPDFWVNQWCEGRPDHEFTKIWRQCDKVVGQYLKAHLPQIAKLSPESTQLLFALCVDTSGVVNLEKMQLLLDEPALNPKSGYVENVFGEDSDVGRFLQVSQATQLPSAAELFLDEKLPTHGKPDAWLDLVLKKGPDSINSVTKRQDDISKLLIEHGQSYDTLIGDRYDEHLDALNVLRKDEKDCFIYLFKQHLQHNQSTDFLRLFDCFVHFKEELRELGITQLPTKLTTTDIKNMPLALSRILAIVKNARADDRQDQLDIALGLNLSSQGAIAVLNRTRHQTSRWHFVTPSMAFNGPDKVRQKSPTPSGFMERAAFQVSGQTASMALLQRVEKDMQRSGWPEEEQRLFENLVLAGVTKTNTPHDAEKAMDHYQSFYGYIYKAPMLRSQVMNMMNDLDNKPSLEVLGHLMRLILGRGSARLVTDISKLLQAATDLKELSSNDALGVSVYEGMRHYQDSDYGRTTLFYDHLEVLRELTSGEGMDVLPKVLAPLVSLFHIQKSDAKGLMGDLNQFDLGRTLELCLILKHTRPDIQPPLKSGNLLELANLCCGKENARSVIDHIKEHQTWKGYFSDQFLEQYGHQQLSAKNQELMECYFPEHQEIVTNILYQFCKSDDATAYNDVIIEMHRMCEGLNRLQQNLLLKTLHQYRTCFKTEEALGSQENPFRRMLAHINADQLHEVMGFFEAVGNESPSHLSSKMLLFLDTILPKMRQKEGGWHFSEIEWMPLMHGMVLHSKAEELDGVADQTMDIMTTLSAIIGTNRPSIRLDLLQLVKVYSLKHGLSKTKNFVGKIDALFTGMHGDDVLAFCMHFRGAEGRHPDRLEALYDGFIDRPELIKVALVMLNNGKGDVFSSEFESLKGIGPAYLDAFYQSPPYPSLSQFLEIIKEHPVDIELKAQKFDLEPAKRNILNGFDERRAEAQMGQFVGYAFRPGDISALKGVVDVAKTMSTQALKEALMKAGKTANHRHLVAYGAELLYRSCGRDGDGGASMEINTTQYLAILSSLQHPSKCVTSQIATGEGKSRIMMISNVCQWAMGKTVDFVTSDVQLAMRDYIEYQAFFDMVGAKTSIITAQTKSASYQVKGINFSDPVNLSLFRNQAKSRRDLGAQDQDKSARVLMLDEADKLFYDAANTRFNYSSSGAGSAGSMTWVYSILMSYFNEEGKLDPYYKDIESSRKDFLSYAKGQCNEVQFAQLSAMSDQQIEQWQESAVTAAALKYNQDFVIAPDELIATSSGAKVSSQAHLLFANRVAKGSKFSFGVHQCLHARLNHIKNDSSQEAVTDLEKAVKACRFDFFIEDEKKIIYSSTNKQLIDDYRGEGGIVRGVTGTAGSLLEREELGITYGMSFLEVPRANQLMRCDNDVQVFKDEKRQTAALIANIKRSQAKGQPILVICDNEEESHQFYQKIQSAFPDQTVAHIHSQLSASDETERVKEAGVAQKITVSTDMIGRGTDFRLQKRHLPNGDQVSAEAGLHVMMTYLPKDREFDQIVGRSGRFGARGESSLITHQQKLIETLGIQQLPKDFSKNMKTFLDNAQLKRARKDEVERVIKNEVGDFRAKLQDEFFWTSPSLASESDWMIFVVDIDTKWNEVWPTIQQLLQDQPNTQAIDQQLAEYRTHVETAWRRMSSQEIIMPPLCLTQPSLYILRELFSVSHEQSHDDRQLPYRYLMASLFAIFTAVLAMTLVFTGMVAPLVVGVIATYALVVTVGAASGFLMGFAVGRLLDRQFIPEPKEVINVTPIPTQECSKSDQFKAVKSIQQAWRARKIKSISMNAPRNLEGKPYSKDQAPKSGRR